MTHLLADLGWVDLDLGCSTVLLGQHRSCSTAQRPVEHPKSKSTQPSPRGDGSPCIDYGSQIILCIDVLIHPLRSLPTPPRRSLPWRGRAPTAAAAWARWPRPPSTRAAPPSTTPPRPSPPPCRPCRPDILALKHISTISDIAICNNPALLVSHFQASTGPPAYSFQGQSFCPCIGSILSWSQTNV